MNQNIKEDFFHIDTHKIQCYTRKSKDANKALIMLPGWPMSSYMFAPMMDYFPEDINCYALNLPGFGGSSTDSNIFHSFNFYSDILENIIGQYITENEVSLLGYSIGGNIGLEYCIKYKAKIKNLIVFSVPINGQQKIKDITKKSPLMGFLFNTLNTHPNLINLTNYKFVRSLISKRLVKRFASNIYDDLDRIDPQFLDDLFNDTKKLSLRAMFDLVNELIKRKYEKETFTSFTCNTLVLGAERDNAISSKQMRYLANELIPNAKLHIFEHYQHDAGISHPLEFSKPIVDFI